MIKSFYAGLTGLSAYASALNIVGNNLANINTTGFKASTMSFHDLVTATFGGIATSAAGNPMQVGLGVLTNSIDGIFSQGSVQRTTEATNVAIEGNGFFVVGNSPEDRYFTRSGNFSFNREGYLVDPSGKYVLGYTQRNPDGTINASGTLAPIYLPANSISPPQETTLARIIGNLNVRDDIGATYSASLTLYDSKGSPHTLSIEFTHNGIVGGNDQWSYEVTLPGDDVVGGVVGTPFVLGNGLIEFDGSGTMVAPAGDVALATPAFTNGSNPLNFTWQLFDENGVGLLTGYPLSSSTSSTFTDGYPPGNLTSMIINNEGVLEGIFSNGQIAPLGQLATATFNNNRGLIRVGQNLFAATLASGTPSIGAPGSGGRGTVIGSALESSNVDIATEFTNMIVFERGYQSNSRIITTSDQILQETLRLKG